MRGAVVLPRDDVSHATPDPIVMCLAISSSGIAVTGLDDGTALIWSMKNSATKLAVAHRRAIVDVAFHPKRDLVATASEDKTVSVWDADTGIELRRLQHDDVVTDVMFVQEETTTNTIMVISVESYDLVTIWRFQDDLQVRVNAFRRLRCVAASPPEKIGLIRHEMCVSCMATGNTGRIFLTASYARENRIWCSETGIRICVFESFSTIDAACFSSDDSKFATEHTYGDVCVWALRPRPDSKMFDAERIVLLEDATSGNNIRLCFMVHDTLLARFGTSGDTYVWDLRNNPEGNSSYVHYSRSSTSNADAVTMTPDHSSFIMESDDGEARIVDARPQGVLLALILMEASRASPRRQRNMRQTTLDEFFGNRKEEKQRQRREAKKRFLLLRNWVDCDGDHSMLVRVMQFAYW